MVIIEAFIPTLVTKEFTQICWHDINIHAFQDPRIQSVHNKRMPETVRRRILFTVFRCAGFSPEFLKHLVNCCFWNMILNVAARKQPERFISNRPKDPTMILLHELQQIRRTIHQAIFLILGVLQCNDARIKIDFGHLQWTDFIVSHAAAI